VKLQEAGNNAAGFVFGVTPHATLAFAGKCFLDPKIMVNANSPTTRTANNAWEIPTLKDANGRLVSQVTQLLPVTCPATGQCFGEEIQSLRGAAAGTGTLERASEFLQDRSKDEGVGSERTAAAGCRSGIFADHVSPIVNGHIYFDPVELGRSPPDPVRVLLQGGHIAIAVRKNSVLRLLLGKAVGAFIWRGCITLSSVEQACLTVSHKIGLGEFSVRDRPITHTYRSKISGALL
jgi:hypothetical protein